jgi:hypothetical protein
VTGRSLRRKWKNTTIRPELAMQALDQKVTIRFVQPLFCVVMGAPPNPQPCCAFFLALTANLNSPALLVDTGMGYNAEH